MDFLIWLWLQSYGVICMHKTVRHRGKKKECYSLRLQSFRADILHTLVVMSAYLSYCCLSIISNLSTHFPLRGFKGLVFIKCHSLDIFSFLDHSLWTVENIASQQVSNFWNASRLAPTTTPYSKSLRFPFLSILMLALNAYMLKLQCTELLPCAQLISHLL